MRWLVVLVGVLCALGSGSAQQCGLSTNGLTYDLSGLGNPNADYQYTSGGVQYSLNVCRNLVQTYTCAAPGVANFVVNFGQEICETVGTMPATFALLDPNDAAGGITGTFSSGMPCQAQSQGNYMLTVNFPCPATDPGSDQLTSAAGDPNNGCHFIYTMTSMKNCPVKQSSSSGKLSGGWVFVIIVLVVSFVYCVGGIGFKKYRGAESWGEAVPNNTFWFALPGLVKEGAVFFWQRLMACIQRARGGSGGNTYGEVG